jgi:hypothetical protein
MADQLLGLESLLNDTNNAIYSDNANNANNTNYTLEDTLGDNLEDNFDAMVNYEQARQQFLEWRAEDRVAFNNRHEEDRGELEQALDQAYNERMLYRAFIFLLLLVISGLILALCRY